MLLGVARLIFRFVVGVTRREGKGQFVDAARSLAFQFVFDERFLPRGRRGGCGGNVVVGRRGFSAGSAAARRRRLTRTAVRISRRGPRDVRRHDAESLGKDDGAVEVDQRIQRRRRRGTGSWPGRRRFELERGDAEGGRRTTFAGATASEKIRGKRLRFLTKLIDDYQPLLLNWQYVKKIYLLPPFLANFLPNAITVDTTLLLPEERAIFIPRGERSGRVDGP